MILVYLQGPYIFHTTSFYNHTQYLNRNNLYLLYIMCVYIHSMLYNTIHCVYNFCAT